MMSWTWSEVFQKSPLAQSSRSFNQDYSCGAKIHFGNSSNSIDQFMTKVAEPGQIPRKTGGGGGQWSRWRPYQSCTRYGDQLSKSAKSVQNAELLANYCQVSDT